MVKKLNSKIITSLILVIVLISFFWFFLLNRKMVESKNEICKVQFSGIVNSKCNLKHRKPTFFLIDSSWVGILGLSIKEYIEIGDSIIKKDSSLKIMKNYDTSKNNCKSFSNIKLYKVTDRKTLRSLSLCKKKKED